MGVQDFAFVEVRREGKWYIAHDEKDRILLGSLRLRVWDIEPFPYCDNKELVEKYHNRLYGTGDKVEAIRGWNLCKELEYDYAPWNFPDSYPMVNVDLFDLITFVSKRTTEAVSVLDGLESVKNDPDMGVFFGRVETILRAYMQREAIDSIKECDVRIIVVTML
jgi:hypothetical protein